MPRTFAPDAVTPDLALQSLREGNQRFVAGEGRAVRQWHPELVQGQSPFAVVLGCADARAPAEYVFDQSLGDLFVIRVAGNIVAPSLVGSVEFAASKFGTRLVVVMGHTQCGAVGATVDALEHGQPESPNLKSIVDLITPHIEPLFKDQRPGDRAARLREAVRVNAVASARELRHSSRIVETLVDKGQVMVVPAVYDLSTGVVTFYDD